MLKFKRTNSTLDGAISTQEKITPHYSLTSHLMFFVLFLSFSGLSAFSFYYSYFLEHSLISSSLIQIVALTLFIIGFILGLVVWQKQEKEKHQVNQHNIIKEASSFTHMKQQSYFYKLIIGGDPPEHKQGLLYWVIIGIFGIGFGSTGLYISFNSFKQPEIILLDVQQFLSMSVTFGLIISFPVWILILVTKQKNK